MVLVPYSNALGKISYRFINFDIDHRFVPELIN